MFEQDEQTGQKCSEGARERLGRDAMARYLGIELEEMRPGYARATMQVKAELLNGAGLTHGGAIFTLADIAFAAASNAHGPLALALNVNIHFVKGSGEGEILTAVAREENLTHKTGLYRMEVKDSAGETVALAEGLVYRRSERK